MKDKQYDPAGNNEKAPEKGMAAVNTFNEGESDTLSVENDKANDDPKKEAGKNFTAEEDQK